MEILSCWLAEEYNIWGLNSVGTEKKNGENEKEMKQKAHILLGVEARSQYCSACEDLELCEKSDDWGKLKMKGVVWKVEQLMAQTSLDVQSLLASPPTFSMLINQGTLQDR